MATKPKTKSTKKEDTRGRVLLALQGEEHAALLKAAEELFTKPGLLARGVIAKYLREGGYL